MNITVQSGQTIFDIATIAYGDCSLSYRLINENLGLIDSVLSDLTGLILNYTPSSPIAKEAVINVVSNKKNVTIQSQQTLFDLALQYYGSAESVYQLISENPNILNVLYTDYIGFGLNYNLNTTAIPSYFRDNNIDISTKDFYDTSLIISSDKEFMDGILFEFMDGTLYEFEG